MGPTGCAATSPGHWAAALPQRASGIPQAASRPPPFGWSTELPRTTPPRVRAQSLPWTLPVMCMQLFTAALLEEHTQQVSGKRPSLIPLRQECVMVFNIRTHCVQAH